MSPTTLLVALPLAAWGCQHRGPSRADSGQGAVAVSEQRVVVDSSQRTVADSTRGAVGVVHSDRRATVDSIPVLVALVPDSVASGSGAPADLVLRGRNFALDSAGGNTVRIGPITLNRIVARAGGTELHVTVPAKWSGTEAPPRPLAPGPYPVVVRTRAGESNVMILRILP